MILQALEQPNVEVSELIAQQKERYQSKLFDVFNFKKKYITYYFDSVQVQ